MNENEIIEGNNLLADFMEYEIAGTINDGEVALYYLPESHPTRCGLTSPDQLDFSTSYDVLMPVWVKFRDLKFDDIVVNRKHYLYCDIFSNSVCTDTIEGAFKNLVTGIKWYKEQKKEIANG